MPDYFIRSLRFDHVRVGGSFWVPAPLVNIISHFGIYNVAERMQMDAVLVVLAFHRMT